MAVSTDPTKTGISSATGDAKNAIVKSLMTGGNADFISVATLTVTLEADTTAFVYNIAGTTYTVASDKTLVVTDDAHNFIYIDVSGTLGRSATPCTYAFTAPGSPATGDYWFDLGADQMKTYNGSAWVAASVIFIGYVLAASGSINARYVCEPIGITPGDRFARFGDGSDGFLDVSSGTTTIDGLKQYSAVVVRATGTLTHTTNTGPVLGVYAQGVLTVNGSAGFDANGKGGSGGNGGTGAGSAGSGTGSGGGGGGGGGGTNAGGAGAGSLFMGANNTSGGGAAGTAGNAGGTSATCHGRIIGKALPLIHGRGNGGGGGGGDGAAGGNGGAGGGTGSFTAASVAIGASAFIRANGAVGSNGPAANRGGGGGGGGGLLMIACRNYWNSGTVSATAGTGGTSGGAGSGIGGDGMAGQAVRVTL